jgi:hypothetical protein
MAEEKGPQWAMATPGVVYMVGVACIGVFALLFGLVNPGAIPVVAAFLIACGVPTMICGAIELRRGDILFGTINMVFGGIVWFGFGFIFAVVAWSWANLGGAPDVLQPDLRMAGYFAAGLSLLFFLFLPTTGKATWVAFLAFLVLGVGVALLSWGLLTGAAFGAFPMNVSGICFLIFGLLVIYLGTVFVVNTVYQAPKLPLGGAMF